MKKIIAAIILAAFTVTQVLGVDMYVNVRDLASGTVAKRKTTVTLIDPTGPVVAGPWLIAGDSVSVYTDANGIANYSNILALGTYRLDVAGNPGRSFPFSVSSTNGGYFNVVSFMGTNNSVPVFYTSDQVDAIVKTVGGTATNVIWPVAGTNMLAETNGLTVTLNSLGGGGSPIAVTNGLTLQTNNGVQIIGLYTAPSILTFNNSVVSVEKGATVSSTTLTWTLGGGAITNQVIDQGIGVIPINLRTTNDSSVYTTSRTYMLMVSDAVTNVIASTAVTFYDQFYYGVTVQPTVNSAQILSLGNSFFSTTRAHTISVSPSAQYTYVCYPQAWGTATFFVGALESTAWNLSTQTFTNASGYASTYNVYRSSDIFTGPYTLTIQ